MYGHYTRRSSVVLNPRGRVLGGLGEEGGGGDAPSGGDGGYGYDSGDSGDGYTGFALARAEAEMAAQDAAYAAKEAAQFANAVQSAEAQAAAIAAAEDAVYAEQEAARFANAAASAKASSAAAQAALAQTVMVAKTVFQAVASMFGPPGFMLALAEKVTNFVGNFVAGTATSAGYSGVQKAITDAREQAGSDPQLNAQINTVQKNLNAVVIAGSDAAVKQLYLTYAKRQPSAAELQYWTARFGTSVTPDEVLQFTDVLYANEPNLRPTVASQQTSAAGLPLVALAAAAAYFFIGA